MDLSSLTLSQAQAVRHRGSPLIVKAGPGTGKTRTLTYRIAHLIETGAAHPDQILAITFTNKAAEEMQSRIDQLSRWIERPAPPWISTFHGFCFRFLRENLSSPFQLLSENEALGLLKETVCQQFPDFPIRSLKDLARHISSVKNNLILPDSPEKLPPWDVYPKWSSCYKAFQEKLADQKLWDFDELLIQAVILLEENSALKTSVQSRYPFAFIDEFQDINYVQYRFFQLLTRENGEWMVIGDPNQAIYGFRGASADFFSRLKLDRPALKEITLKETFRLNQTLLTASSQVMQGAAGDLLSVQKGGASLPVIGLASAEDEGEYLTRIIETEMGGLSFSSKEKDSVPNLEENPQRSFADFAVLYRLHAQGEQLARIFSKKGIPFKRIQEVHWVERPEIRAVLIILKSILNSDISPSAAVEKVISDENSQVHPTAPEGIEALKKLWLWAATFKGSLRDFIEVLSIQTGLDTYEPDQETVKLLTLHAAKGLEFPIVIIPGCEENLLPLSLLKESDPEEERRLFYVGLTRAKEKVFLTWAKKRILLGQNLVQSPSPFIDDIEAVLKDRIEWEGIKRPRRPVKRQMSLFEK